MSITSDIAAAIVTTRDRDMDLSAQLYDAIPDLHPYVFVDSVKMGCTANHLRAWDHLSRQATDWSLVLEDDAILCPGFDHQLREVLSHAPGPVVSLYLGRGRPPQWQRKAARAVATDWPYIACTSLLHAVAVAIRTDWLVGERPAHRGREAGGGMINAATTAAVEGGKPIDEAITEWCKHEAIPVFYSNPSIVDHNAALPSVAQHPAHEEFAQSERVAHKFGVRSGLPGKSRWYPGIAIM